MANTTSNEIIDFFESSFTSKVELPYTLEMVWLKRAIGVYSNEISDVSFTSSTLNDNEVITFDEELKVIVIELLAMYMRLFYQEREVSLINKRSSIVTKELSWDGNGNNKKYANEELIYYKNKIDELTHKLKTNSYS